MNAPQTHLDKPHAREITCPVDGTVFTTKRRWQRFCSTACRNHYHGSMTPEALRRDIDALKAEVSALAQRLQEKPAA